MKKKITIIVLILSLGLNLGVFATFGRHWLKRREFRKGPEESSWLKRKMRKELNLTNSQVALMEQSRKNIGQEIKPIKEELKRKRVELFTLLEANPVDSAKVDKLIDAISLLQARIEKTVVNHIATMKKNLTPEQQQKFKAMMPKGFMGPPPDQAGFGRTERSKERKLN